MQRNSVRQCGADAPQPRQTVQYAAGLKRPSAMPQPRQWGRTRNSRQPPAKPPPSSGVIRRGVKMCGVCCGGNSQLSLPECVFARRDMLAVQRVHVHTRRNSDTTMNPNRTNQHVRQSFSVPLFAAEACNAAHVLQRPAASPGDNYCFHQWRAWYNGM